MDAMKRLKSFDQNWIGLLIAYIVLDLLFVAGGMGVPIFCIIFGLAIGWFTAMRARVFRADLRAAMRLNIRYAAIASLVTFVLMAVIWGRMLPLFFDPVIDYGNMGLPLILYDPRLSFVGWLVLMIVISPVLQFFVILCGSYFTFLLRPRWWQDGVPTTEQQRPNFWAR